MSVVNDVALAETQPSSRAYRDPNRRVTIEAANPHPGRNGAHDGPKQGKSILAASTRDFNEPTSTYPQQYPAHLPPTHERSDTTWSQRVNASQSIDGRFMVLDFPAELYAETQNLEAVGPVSLPRMNMVEPSGIPSQAANRPLEQPYSSRSAPELTRRASWLGRRSIRRDPFSPTVPSRLNTYSGSNPAVSTKSGEQNWPEILAYCKQYDQDMLEDWIDEIDTLLVFAGLFSAVLTAFVIESYQSLHPEYERLSSQALIMISQQLAASASGASPLPAFDGEEDPLVAKVALNVLWFLSLIASLTSAFFAIILKQAFREYKGWTNVSRAPEALRLRQLRFAAFGKWQVESIAAACPSLLAISVQLFMAGLPVFLLRYNLTMAIVVSVFVGLFLLFTVSAVILPTFVPDFPFKSPEAWAVWATKTAIIRSTNPFRRWLRHELMPVSSPGKDAFARDEEEKTRLDTKWRDRDIRNAKKRERFYLWSLLKWLCQRWHDHRLATAVKECTADLIYGRNASDKTYVNVVGAIPAMLGENEHVWRTMVATCKLPSSTMDVLFPGLVKVDKDAGEKLQDSVNKVPWKMLALFADELILGLHTAIDDGFKSPAYDIDPRRVCVLYGFCFLEYLFEPATFAGLEESLTSAWIALLCDACRNPIPIPGLRDDTTGRDWTLADILIPWLKTREMTKVSYHATLRFLLTVSARRPSGAGRWNDLEMQQFSIMSSCALHAVMSSIDSISQRPTLGGAVEQISRTIEEVIRFSTESHIPNCGLSQFPWLHEILIAAPYLSRTCLLQIQEGFKSGLFTTRDHAGQMTLMEVIREFMSTEKPSNMLTQPVTQGDSQLRDSDYTSSSVGPLLRTSDVGRQGHGAVSNRAESSLSRNSRDLGGSTLGQMLTESPTSEHGASQDAFQRDANAGHLSANHADYPRASNTFQRHVLHRLLQHGTALRFDVSDVQTDPYEILDGQRSEVADVQLSQAALNPPTRRIELRIHTSAGAFPLQVTPAFNFHASEQSMVTVLDVIQAVQAFAHSAASDANPYRVPASVRQRIQDVYNRRCRLRQLATTEPVRHVDLLDSRPVFSGLVLSDSSEATNMSNMPLYEVLLEELGADGAGGSRA